MELTTGMRCSTSFHSCTSRAPKKLVASRPVTKTMTSVKMAPRPGMWKPIQLSVCSATGSSSSDWSSTSKMNFSTQIVMISGIQISSPVMKYFLTAPETKRPGSRRAGWLVAVYSVSGASRLLRLGFRFGFRFSFRFAFRVGLGFDLRCGLLFGRFLEVRGVPAGALQLEAGRAQQLLKRRFAAGRALGERRLRGLLQELFLMATLLAAVFVDRHRQPLDSDYIADFGGENRKSRSPSERNIVFHVVELAGGLLRGWVGFGGLALGGLGLGARPRRLAGAGARPEHLHDVAAYLGAIAVLPFLVLPLARAQGSLDVHLRALLQVLARDLRQAPEKGDAVPFGRLLHLAARLVLPAIGRRHPNVRHRVAAWRVASLRVGAQIADDDDLVHRCHVTPPSCQFLPDNVAVESSLTGTNGRIPPAAQSHTAERTAQMPNTAAAP